MVTVKFGTNGVQQGESCFVYSKTAKERSDRKRRKTNEKKQTTNPKTNNLSRELSLVTRLSIRIRSAERRSLALDQLLLLRLDASILAYKTMNY